jgi:hypothetical protein
MNVLNAIVLALTLAPQPPAAAADVAEFTRLELQWMDALAAKDETTLQAIVAPEFKIIGTGSTVDGLTTDRTAWMRVGLARPFPKHEVSNVQVTRVADVAIVQFVLSGTYPPRSLTPEGGRLDFLTTDVWAKRDGKWQVVSRHSSLPRAPVAR